MNHEIYGAYLRTEKKRQEERLRAALSMRVEIPGGSVAVNSEGKPVPGTFEPAAEGSLEEALKHTIMCAGAETGRLEATAKMLKFWRENPEEREAFLQKAKEGFSDT